MFLIFFTCIFFTSVFRSRLLMIFVILLSRFYDLRRLVGMGGISIIANYIGDHPAHPDRAFLDDDPFHVIALALPPVLAVAALILNEGLVVAGAALSLNEYLILSLALGHPLGDALVGLPLLVLGLPHGDVLGPALRPLVMVIDSSSRSSSSEAQTSGDEKVGEGEVKHFVKSKVCLCVPENLCDLVEKLRNRRGLYPT